jgi:GH24 family phage-related lysozyme (muramidase)
MNIGCSKFSKSKLLVKVNREPDDISIKDEFRILNIPPKKTKRSWDLVYRRNAEADFYFGRRLL